MTSMTDTTHTTTAAATTDTVEALGAAAGNARQYYWQCVDISDYIVFVRDIPAERVEAAKIRTAEALTSWKRAESAFEVARAGLNMGTPSAPGVVFVELMEYAPQSWVKVPR